MKIIAILAAAGRGERLGGAKAKLWAEIGGKPLIYYSIDCIESSSVIDGIIIMVPADDITALKNKIREWGFKKVMKILGGGERRQDTVRIGLESLPKTCDLVMIHDAARPLASPALFARVVEAARRAGAATAAIQPVDTIVQIGDAGAIEYLDRSRLRHIQTPQAFKVKIIREAHARALKEGVVGTDDAGLVLRIGQKIEIIAGEAWNFKVTSPEDLARLEHALRMGAIALFDENC